VVCVLKTGFCGKQTGSLRTVYGLKSPHDSVPYAIHVYIYIYIKNYIYVYCDKLLVNLFGK